MNSANGWKLSHINPLSFFNFLWALSWFSCSLCLSLKGSEYLIFALQLVRDVENETAVRKTSLFVALWHWSALLLPWRWQLYFFSPRYGQSVSLPVIIWISSGYMKSLHCIPYTYKMLCQWYHNKAGKPKKKWSPTYTQNWAQYLSQDWILSKLKYNSLYLNVLIHWTLKSFKDYLFDHQLWILF